MRNQTEQQEVTRLLIQKPTAHADLEENAHIAISVLGDDGWTVSRVGLDCRVNVTNEMIAPNHIFALLTETENKYAELRKGLVKQQVELRFEGCYLAAIACALCAGSNAAGLPWAMALLALCFVAAGAWIKFQGRRKGGL